MEEKLARMGMRGHRCSPGLGFRRMAFPRMERGKQGFPRVRGEGDRGDRGSHLFYQSVLQVHFIQFLSLNNSAEKEGRGQECLERSKWL